MPPVPEAGRSSARAWCRVDLAGGTLDIWPLGLLHAGARTVNVAIDTPVTVTMRSIESGYRVRQGSTRVEAVDRAQLTADPEGALVGRIVGALDLPPAEITIESASPRGAGLGASSALAVAAIAAGEALLGLPASPVEMKSALARDIEAALMSLPTGRQDYFPAILGGALEVLHRPGGELVRRLPGGLEALGEALVVAYTGRSHLSAATNWSVIRRRLEGDPQVVEAFDGIAAAAEQAASALTRGDLEELGRAMAEEWRHRRQLAPGVSTPEIERLLSRAREAGAWGGKACGAGGGGCVAVLGPATARGAVEEALRQAGATILETAPTTEPLAVTTEP